MRITLLSAGHTKKKGPFFDLFETYRKRLSWRFDDIVIDPRKHVTAVQQEKSFLDLIPKNSYVIAMDERGKTLTSPALSIKISETAQIHTPHFCFIIGGADGLSENMRKKADFLLSFGKQTWPHQMVRVMLIEQIYRSQQILSGHPYHRD